MNCICDLDYLGTQSCTWLAGRSLRSACNWIHLKITSLLMNYQIRKAQWSLWQMGFFFLHFNEDSLLYYIIISHDKQKKKNLCLPFSDYIWCSSSAPFFPPLLLKYILGYFYSNNPIRMRWALNYCIFLAASWDILLLWQGYLRQTIPLKRCSVVTLFIKHKTHYCRFSQEFEGKRR